MTTMMMITIIITGTKTTAKQTKGNPPEIGRGRLPPPKGLRIARRPWCCPPVASVTFWGARISPAWLCWDLLTPPSVVLHEVLTTAAVNLCMQRSAVESYDVF